MTALWFDVSLKLVVAVQPLHQRLGLEALLQCLQQLRPVEAAPGSLPMAAQALVPEAGHGWPRRLLPPSKGRPQQPGHVHSRSCPCSTTTRKTLMKLTPSILPSDGLRNLHPPLHPPRRPPRRLPPGTPRPHSHDGVRNRHRRDPRAQARVLPAVHQQRVATARPGRLLGL